MGFFFFQNVYSASTKKEILKGLHKLKISTAKQMSLDQFTHGRLNIPKIDYYG